MSHMNGKLMVIRERLGLLAKENPHIAVELDECIQLLHRGAVVQKRWHHTEATPELIIRVRHLRGKYPMASVHQLANWAGCSLFALDKCLDALKD